MLNLYNRLIYRLWVCGIVIISLLALLSCGGGKQEPELQTVRIGVWQEPRCIHPTLYNSPLEGKLSNLCFQYLIDLDPETLKPKPLLADSLPEIVKNKKGNFEAKISIKEGATWNDRSPIDADDIILSYKLLLNPFYDQVFNESQKSFLIDIRKDEEDSKTVILEIRNDYPEMLFNVVNIHILAAHKTDPGGILNQFPISDFLFNPQKLKDLEQLEIFSRELESKAYNFDKDLLEGSGPYDVSVKKAGYYLSFEKKRAWWGKQYQNEDIRFQNNPEKLRFDFISDPFNMELRLSNGELDIADELRPDNYLNLKTKAKSNSEFYFPKTEMFKVIFLAFNKESELFSSRLTRKAFAHLINRKAILEYTREGFGVLTGHPFIGITESNITLPQYSLDSAIHYFSQDGWVDLDGDGFLEKAINGQKRQLEFEYFFTSSSLSARQTGILLTQECEKAGVKLVMKPLEIGALADHVQKRDFDMFRFGITIFPIGFDWSQVLAKKSFTEGQNYSGFGNDRTDIFVQLLSRSRTEEERQSMMQKLAKEIIKDYSWNFLYFPESISAVSNKFDSVGTSPVTDGIWFGSLKTRK